MTVHQCPICELRFAFRTELESHVVEDHPDRIRPGFPSTAHPPGHLMPVDHPRHPSRPH